MQQQNTVMSKTPGLYRLVLLWLVMAACMVQLSACGWRLRGSYDFPPSLAAVYVEGAARYSALGNEIHSAFEGTNAKLVNSLDQATAILHIVSDKADQRVLSTDSRGRASEYEISYVLRFKVTSAMGENLVGIQQVTAQREYRFDPNNVLATGGEVDRLQQDMIRNSVQQMMRRINAAVRNR